MIARLAISLPLMAAFWSLAAGDAAAQSLTLDLGEGGGELTGRILQIFLLMTVLSLAPSILIMVTSFTRIVVVLSLLRSAMGVQQTPPNVVLVSLALFLTAFVMAPTFERAYTQGVLPLMNEEVDELEAFQRGTVPMREFMLTHVREKDLAAFLDLAEESQSVAGVETPLHVLIPAFVISELRRAFEIAFLIFIPFLIIDMVVASVLMAMGMMMLPPIIIALPFKIIFFVLVDGWYMIVGSLVRSFGG